MPKNPEDKPKAGPDQQGVDLTPHPIVREIFGESEPHSHLVTLVGYLGTSRKDDTVRLYTSLEFHTHYEIPRAAVARTESTDPNDANAPNRVYVISTAKIELVQVSRQSLEASLLGGSIASAHPTTAASVPDQPVPSTVFCLLFLTQPPCTAITGRQCRCT